MVESRVSAEMLIDDLSQLCALPGSHEHDDDLALVAARVAELMRQRGLQSEIVTTAGAPVVIGRRSGRSPFTLLLYHHYDTAPSGPWRSWNHEPYQLAERDGNLFARGVADGKGPLVAHLAALAGVIEAEGELPCNVVVLVEGESLIGSPHLGMVVTDRRDALRAQACLASAGERDASGRPICYSGVKGLLQARLTVVGANQTLGGGMSASVPNPLWRLIWALNAVKSDQEEILVEGFYDDVESISRAENQSLRAFHMDEAGRLEAWGLGQFLFEMTGITLLSAEATLPTCNVSALSVEPQSDLATIPVVATARIDFQLVPRQRPHGVIEQLREHLKNKEFTDLTVERLAGGYPPASTKSDHPFIQAVREAGRASYGEPLDRLPLGPFSLPLFFFAEAYGMPVAVVGCARHESAVHASNENIPLADLVRHGQMLIELLAQQHAKPAL